MDAKSELKVLQMHQTYNLRGLLIPWFMFRAYIKFKPSVAHNTFYPVSRTFYGDEHDCTYKQCLAGYVDKITLDRLRGYTELVRIIEDKKFSATYITAKIYGRLGTGDLFNTVHREYYKGKLAEDTVNDPAIDTTDQFKILQFQVHNSKLIIKDKF